MKAVAPGGLVWLLLFASPALAAELADIEWRHQANDGRVSLRVNPLGHNQRAAFFEARGFSAEAIHPYLQTCGFSIGMINDGRNPIRTLLADWRVIDARGRKIALRLPENWDQEWARRKVSSPARIAFRWAQFQSDNRFESGDWIMGMATLESRPQPPFQLTASYLDTEGVHDIVLDSLECARD